MAQEFLIALGSNLGSAAGDNADTLAAALGEIAANGVALRRVSRFFRTPCFPAGAGPDFVNACAALRGDVQAGTVLNLLHGIETRFGRTRTQRWASRTLDLDLLAEGDSILPDPETQAHWRTIGAEQQRATAPDRLILPHPRLQERGFVLVPLADIAADWRHPALHLTVAEMLAALPAGALDGISPLQSGGARGCPL
jgi:2-amino-4-hydroxy-6-hydroxymethyldihydropteridine diphosphokinase